MTYNGTAAWYWLRSAKDSIGNVGLAGTAQLRGSFRYNGERGVRPALPEELWQGNGTDAWYWLRSPKHGPYSLGIVHITGSASDWASSENPIGGVRPALPEESRQSSAPGPEHRVTKTAPPIGIGSARRALPVRKMRMINIG